MVPSLFSLGPEIFKAEGQAFSEDQRHYYAHRVRRLTKLLVATCERIQYSTGQSKDFLQMLKKELKFLKKLQRTWILTL